MFFTLSTFRLFVVLVVIAGLSVTVGVVAGRWMRSRPGAHHQPVDVVRASLLGLIGLLLAFGLTMAVGRYEVRRTVLVREANDISTAYLRAELLPEPERTASLDLLREYADAAVVLADQVPDTGAFDAAVVEVESLQDDLWASAGDAVREDPTGTGPRLYAESLNAVFNTHGERVASLRNRVPWPVMMLEVAGSAVVLAVFSLYLTLLERGITTSVLTAAVLVLILFVSFDLDRPERGFITVPSRPLVHVRATMDEGSAATGG